MQSAGTYFAVTLSNNDNIIITIIIVITKLLLLLLLLLSLLSTSQGDLYFHLPRDPTPPIPYHCATSVFDLLLQKFLGEIIKLNLLLFQNDSNNIFSLSDIETIAGLDCCGKRQILTENAHLRL